MMRRIPISVLLLVLLCPRDAASIETAPRISDREIIERLTKLEESQKDQEAKIEANAEAIAQFRNDMHTQFDRIDAQLNRLFQLTLGILGAFAAIVAATIGFALGDRRIMLPAF